MLGPVYTSSENSQQWDFLNFNLSYTVLWKKPLTEVTLGGWCRGKRSPGPAGVDDGCWLFGIPTPGKRCYGPGPPTF